MNGSLIPISLHDIKELATMYEITDVSNLIYLITVIDSWHRNEHAKKMHLRSKEAKSGSGK